MMQRKFLAAILVLGFVTLAGGCAFQRPLHIEPVSKKASIITPKFSDAVYYYDRDHNLYFILRSFGTDKDTGKPVQQIVTFRMFWHPAGGKTTLDPTALDVTYRYLVITPDSIGMYEGAGFMRVNGKDGKAKIRARLLQGDLRLTEASANFVDTLGRARLKGYFTAEYDDARAMDMLLAAHREFFSRSLESKPGQAPRTEDSDFYEPGGVTPDTLPAPASTQPAMKDLVPPVMPTELSPATRPTTQP